MSENNKKYLELFPGWLKSLGEDVAIVLESLKEDGLQGDTRCFLTGGINYLFKSLDLVPDGIDDIGYLDDAFVLRVAAKAAVKAGTGSISPMRVEGLERLAGEVGVIEEFLAPDLYRRFEAYVQRLSSGAARGRTVDDIVENRDVFDEFATEAESFTAAYKTPAFGKDEKNLIKLKAFFDAKLPK